MSVYNGKKFVLNPPDYDHDYATGNAINKWMILKSFPSESFASHVAACEVISSYIDQT